MSWSENISFQCTKKNKKEPSKCQAHMHVAKPEISFQDSSVNKTFKENLFKLCAKEFRKILSASLSLSARESPRNQITLLITTYNQYEV